MDCISIKQAVKLNLCGFNSSFGVKLMFFFFFLVFLMLKRKFPSNKRPFNDAHPLLITHHMSMMWHFTGLISNCMWLVIYEPYPWPYMCHTNSVKRFSPHVSRFASHVSRLTSRVSRLASHVWTRGHTSLNVRREINPNQHLSDVQKGGSAVMTELWFSSLMRNESSMLGPHFLLKAFYHWSCIIHHSLTTLINDSWLMF